MVKAEKDNPDFTIEGYLGIEALQELIDEECNICGNYPSTRYLHKQLKKEFCGCDTCLIYMTPEELYTLVSQVPQAETFYSGKSDYEEKPSWKEERAKWKRDYGWSD